MKRNPDITQTMTDTLAARAWFVFTVNLMDDVGVEGYEGNDFVIHGQGVGTLDRILRGMRRYPRGRFRLDYGGLVQDVRDVFQGNVCDLRESFVDLYGEVDKPDVWDDRYVSPPDTFIETFDEEFFLATFDGKYIVSLADPEEPLLEVSRED